MVRERAVSIDIFPAVLVLEEILLNFWFGFLSEDVQVGECYVLSL